jgi:cytochrome bd-type quinol oxidase subunit 2
MKYIRLTIATITLLFGVGSVVLTPAALAASPQATVCATLGSNGSCTSTPANGLDLDKVITAIVNIFSIVVGIVAVFMIIVAGIRFVTSGGDSNNVSSARSTIIYALVGLAVVVLSQVIVKFVLNRITR